MERRSGFANNPKHVAIIVICTIWVFKQMLPESRTAGFSCNFRFARRRWLFSLGTTFVSNTRWNILFYSILQYLGSAFYVAIIALARKFINNGTFLCGRNAILLNGPKGLFRTINNTIFRTINNTQVYIQLGFYIS